MGGAVPQAKKERELPGGWITTLGEPALLCCHAQPPVLPRAADAHSLRPLPDPLSVGASNACHLKAADT